MKLLILPKYHSEGSSSRYRYYNYAEWFRQANFEVTSRPLLYNGYVRDVYARQRRGKRIIMTFYGILSRLFYVWRNKKKFDCILIEKELVTFLPFFAEQWMLRGTKFIVDYDDNINARYQTGWTAWLLSKKIEQLARMAQAVTTGNHWYRELYKNIDPAKIHYLPTVINRDLYAAKDIIKSTDQPLTIVWIGSPATEHYLQSIDAVLAGLAAQYPFVLKIIGGTIPLNTKAIYVPWSAATEIRELQQADIGIMPLYDSDWEKGKCGLKLIQYMAAGLPVVASYSVANSDIVIAGTGFIAKTRDEWSEAISSLLQSAQLRKQLGEEAKQRAFDHYSYQVWAPVFTVLISSVATEN